MWIFPDIRGIDNDECLILKAKKKGIYLKADEFGKCSSSYSCTLLVTDFSGSIFRGEGKVLGTRLEGDGRAMKCGVFEEDKKTFY